MEPCAYKRAVDLVPEIGLLGWSEVLDVIAGEEDFIHLDPAFAFVRQKSLPLADIDVAISDNLAVAGVDEFLLELLSGVHCVGLMYLSRSVAA